MRRMSVSTTCRPAVSPRQRTRPLRPETSGRSVHRGMNGDFKPSLWGARGSGWRRDGMGQETKARPHTLKRGRQGGGKAGPVETSPNLPCRSHTCAVGSALPWLAGGPAV
jgi:hypothetical protein